MSGLRNSLIATGALLGVAFGTSAPAWAQTVGAAVSGRIDVGGKQVPLPPGEFTVVAVENLSASLVKSGAATDRMDLGPIRSVTLAQVADGRVTAVVEAAANLLPYHDGWGTTADCTRKDLYAAVTRYKSGFDVSCLYLKPVPVGAEVPLPGGNAVRQFATARKASLGDFWLTAGLRNANRQDVVDVRYSVDPAILGAPAKAANAAAWSPEEIERNPAGLTAVKDLAAWAARMAEPLDDGLRGRMTGNAFPAFAGAAAVDVAEIERAARVDALTALRNSGSITAEEFDRQVATVTTAASAAAAAAAGGWTYAQVAGWKAFTYRVVVTTINAGIDYVFIGRPFAAGVLVVLQVVVNTTKFFFHEMMWQEVFGISPLQREAPNVIEFGRRVVTASAG